MARRLSLKGIARALCLAACTGLAGCQGSTLGEGLEGAANPGAAPVLDGSYGSGPVAIAILLPGDPAKRQQAADLADGARLAVDDLGGGQIRIDFLGLGSGSGEAAARVRVATTGGARLIIGPASNADVAAIRSAAIQSHPPILALVTNSAAAGSGIWPLYPDAIDSALEGVGAAVAAKQKTFVVVHEAGMPADDLFRLREGIQIKGGTAIGFVPYPADGTNLGAVFAKDAVTFDKAEAMVLLGGGAAVGQVLDILAAGEFGKSIATAIATSVVPEGMLQRPSAQGLMVAKPSISGLSLIAERFKARFGRSPSYDAAVGYDSIAIAAGLVRTGGQEAITAASLTSGQGFRATTGLFRFRPDGRLERRMVLYRIENGSLNLVQDEGEGF